MISGPGSESSGIRKVGASPFAPDLLHIHKGAMGNNMNLGEIIIDKSDRAWSTLAKVRTWHHQAMAMTV
jgi:hypothetical protein